MKKRLRRTLAVLTGIMTMLSAVPVSSQMQEKRTATGTTSPSWAMKRRMTIWYPSASPLAGWVRLNSTLD